MELTIKGETAHGFEKYISCSYDDCSGIKPINDGELQSGAKGFTIDLRDLPEELVAQLKKPLQRATKAL